MATAWIGGKRAKIWCPRPRRLFSLAAGKVASSVTMTETLSLFPRLAIVRFRKASLFLSKPSAFAALTPPKAKITPRASPAAVLATSLILHIGLIVWVFILDALFLRDAFR